MRCFVFLPNKLYTFSESTLALLTPVLDALGSDPASVTALCDRVSPTIGSTDFLDALTCLYALRAIDYDDQKGAVTRA